MKSCIHGETSAPQLNFGLPCEHQPPCEGFNTSASRWSCSCSCRGGPRHLVPQGCSSSPSSAGGIAWRTFGRFHRCACLRRLSCRRRREWLGCWSRFGKPFWLVEVSSLGSFRTAQKASFRKVSFKVFRSSFPITINWEQFFKSCVLSRRSEQGCLFKIRCGDAQGHLIPACFRSWPDGFLWSLPGWCPSVKNYSCIIGCWVSSSSFFPSTRL